MSLIIQIEGKNQVKKKGFCPNPVAQYGIPEYADSDSFPDVKGTNDWRDWWEEQIQYCIGGYQTGGTWISGRYYYYLNFAYMNTVGRGFHHPDFVDTDMDFFLLTEYCKKNNKGLISIKARRRGLSFKANKGIIEYGSKFLGEKYMGGICAGLKSYADDFFDKLTDTEAVTAPELQLNVLINNTMERTYGYPMKNNQNVTMDSGSLNQILVRTAFQSGNVFKGTQLDDCIFEESGEFKNLLDTYEATKWCFMDGDKMIGTPYVYGTGGNMNTSSKDFAEMWTNADAYDLERFWVPGSKIHKPCFAGGTNTQGDVEEQIPNIIEKYGHLEKEQYLGMEDVEESTRQILLKRQQLAKSGNKKQLTLHLQNNPLNVKEAFISSADNNYDSAILQTRIMELMGMDQLHLDVVVEPEIKDGKLVSPIKPVIRLAITNIEAPNRDPEWKICKLFRWPEKGVNFLDGTGADSYDQDQSKTSSSLGGILVYRQKNIILSDQMYGPVFTYYKRPPRKEQFFMIAMLTAIAYGGPNSLLVDAGSPTIIDWIISNMCEYILAYRPRSLEAPNSTQQHQYGLKFTVMNRPILEADVQSEILDNGHNWFDPELLSDCSSYNTGDNENDSDLHDALLLAKAYHKDSGFMPQSDVPVDKKDRVRPKIDGNGNVYYDNKNEHSTRNYSGDIFMNLINKGTY